MSPPFLLTTILLATQLPAQPREAGAPSMTAVSLWVGSSGDPSGQPKSTSIAQDPPPTPETPAQHLQTLLTAQRAALATDDPAQILPASTSAAALALRLAATLDLAAGHLADARTLLLRSSTLDPQPATTLLLLTADLRANNPADIAADTAALLQLTGDTAPAHFLLAQTFEAADDLAPTVRELTRALALDPQLPALHLALGIAFWRLNEYQYNPDSLREFTLAQQADPGAFLANIDLASLLSQYHRFPEAAHFLQLAAAADPNSPDPTFQLGMNLYSEADYTAARPALEQAVQLTANDSSHNNFQIRRALIALSRIAALEHRSADAEQLNAQAEHLHQQLLASGEAPTLTESTGLLVGAGASHATPNPSAAIANPTTPAAAPTNALHQQLLTLAASTLNDAGTALARTHDYAAALPLFRAAAETDPTLPPVLRNLGLAAFHTAAYPEAATALTRALQLDANDTLARRYLNQIPPQTNPTTPQH